MKKAEAKAFSNFVEEMERGEDRDRSDGTQLMKNQCQVQRMMEDRELEAQRTWKVGKDLGLIMNQSDDEIKNCLVEMEIREEEDTTRDKERKSVVS